MSDSKSSLELVRLFSRLVRFLAMYGEEHQQPRQALKALKKALDHDLQVVSPVSFALQGEVLLVQGVFQPAGEVAVKALVPLLRNHGVNSFSFVAGVSEAELVQFAKILNAKPQDVVADGTLKPEAVQGFERIRINDVRYVAVREGQSVVDGAPPPPAMPPGVADAVKALAAEAGALAASAGKAVPSPGGVAAGEAAAALAAAGGIAPDAATASAAAPKTVTVPLDQLVALLQARGAAGGLPAARTMALDSLAGHVVAGGESVSGQLQRALEQLPEELRAELASPAGRADLSAAVVARQAESVADDTALRAAFREMAAQAGGILPLLETIGRLAPKTGHGATLDALGRLMKFLPEVDKLEDVLRGHVLVVDGDAARREAYREALAVYGYTAEAVGSGAEALARTAARADLAAVVADLDLPDMACGALLSRLRRARASTPVVVVSPTAEAAAADFEVMSYPRKRIVASLDPGAVAEAVRRIAVPPQRPAAEADKADRERAREIQERLIPRDLPVIPGWETAFAYKPAKEVGGDYLDVFPLDAERVGFVVGDVSGKGFSGAMVMVMVRSAFRMAAPGCATPRETAAAVNQLVRADIKRGMFVSVVYGCLHVPSGRLAVVNCGHNPPVAVGSPGEAARLLSGGSLPLGVAAPQRFDPILREEEIALAPGGRILFYTDGVVEAMNLDEVEYGEKAFLDLVGRLSADSSRKVVDAAQAALAAHRGAAAQSDDITLLDLRRLPE